MPVTERDERIQAKTVEDAVQFAEATLLAGGVSLANASVAIYSVGFFNGLLLAHERPAAAQEAFRVWQETAEPMADYAGAVENQQGWLEEWVEATKE